MIFNTKDTTVTKENEEKSLVYFVSFVFGLPHVG